MSDQITWTIDRVQAMRDRALVDRDGNVAVLRCYFGSPPSGWAVFECDGLDIWTAARVLNDRDARPLDEGHAPLHNQKERP